MSILRKPAPAKSAQWAKWDDTNQKWLLCSQPDPSRFYFWLGAAAEAR